MQRLLRITLLVQGFYYSITGAWPLLDMSTFEAVTGPKIEHWLVQTVGVLALVIGVTLLFGGQRDRPASETVVLSFASILGFTCVDVIFVARGAIDPIYLADAAAQIIFLVGVGMGWYAGERKSSDDPL